VSEGNIFGDERLKRSIEDGVGLSTNKIKRWL